ncbi:MAG TPA: TetR/AcrR family transcriptional regulator [Terriglobales bacterium]|nr:TetR/AcrR family transcriptional regulator [Terriglobales bacterium]
MEKDPADLAGAVRSPGRPRSQEARKAILESTLELLRESGFADLSIESIAAHAGVGKATVYRWWPNKGGLVMDAFVSIAEQELSFPPTGPVEKAIREQMKRWSAIFGGPLGRIIAAVIGAGQSEPEMLEAFQNYYVEPRRREARELLKQAMKNGEIRPNLNPNMILDILYGPLYFRLLIKSGPLTVQFIDEVFEIVWPGLRIK